MPARRLNLRERRLPRSTIEEKSSEANPNRLSFSITADQPGWLVISDTWYPGWRLWVDGSPAPLYRANYLFRAVRLLEGRHEVVLGLPAGPLFTSAPPYHCLGSSWR